MISIQCIHVLQHRSWSFVSELLEDDDDEQTLTDPVSGPVGEGLAEVYGTPVAGQMSTPDIL